MEEIVIERITSGENTILRIPFIRTLHPEMTINIRYIMAVQPMFDPYLEERDKYKKDLLTRI